MTTQRQSASNNVDDLDDSVEWEPSAEEVIYLTEFASEKHAVLTIGLVDNIPLWKVGKAAGFSGGDRDIETQRRNWMSAASRAIRKRGRILPHIMALKKQLEDFRSGAGKPPSITRKEMLERCDWVMRNGTPSEVLRAVQVKDGLTGKERGAEVNTAQVMRQFIGKTGPERTARGLRDLGCGNLIFKHPELFPGIADAQDTETRLERLEAEHGERKRGPIEGTTGGSPGDFDGDGSPGTGEDSPARVGTARPGGRAAVDGVGGGERVQHPATRHHIGADLAEREYRRKQQRKTPEQDEADMRLFQEAIGLGVKSS